MRLFTVALGLVTLLACDDGAVDGDDTDLIDTDTDADDDVVEGDLCAGAGPASVELGEGGRDHFEAWEEGGTVSIVKASTGTVGFWVELNTSGLDTAEAATIVYRMRINNGPSDDWVTRTLILCEDGPGWVQSFLELPSEYQSETLAEPLDGASVNLTASVTDTTPITETGEVDVTFDLSWR
jgi:hypothetical protein